MPGVATGIEGDGWARSLQRVKGEEDPNENHEVNHKDDNGEDGRRSRDARACPPSAPRAAARDGHAAAGWGCVAHGGLRNNYRHGQSNGHRHVHRDTHLYDGAAWLRRD
jgi:hypothetical protein